MRERGEEEGRGGCGREERTRAGGGCGREERRSDAAYIFFDRVKI
jgi:hypothetical protein